MPSKHNSKNRQTKYKKKINSKNKKEPIAIIGIGCRFPGANGPEGFWNLLRNGVDAITEVPASRYPVDVFYDPQPGIPGKICTRWGGFIENADLFDPYFFGISPREAKSMDPQQRLLLEVAWEALEDAGQTSDTIYGSNTGVFIGMCNSDYSDLQIHVGDSSTMSLYTATGVARSVMSGRLSYIFRLEGPSLMTDTACSSSLVAAHLACQSLWSGECEMAIAGGVNLILTPEATMCFSVASMMALDGKCKAFDARGDGFVRSDGIGAIILKTLSKAQEDRDPIYAVIRGSAINNDGYGTGMMTPRREGQEAVIRDAYKTAGLTPGQVHYIEAHGTGTNIGDPVEALALGTVLSKEKSKDNPCIIGSVKGNVGHMEGTAGIGGIIKVALSLKHRAIPPSLHFQEPNPNIPWGDLPLKVQTEYGPWPTSSGPALCGVSSFGISGANAHMVIEEAPRTTKKMAETQKDDAKAKILTLSARSQKALESMSRAYHSFLSDGGAGADLILNDICYTASVRRTHHEHRLAVIGHSRNEMAEKLETFLRGERIRGLSVGEKLPNLDHKLVFVISPTGSQWVGMGLELIKTEPVFGASMERCDHLFRRWVDWSLIEELNKDEAHSRLNEMQVVQPILFAMQVSLDALWRSWGIVPDAVIGHSLGETAAAHIAGILNLEDAIQVICNRSILVHERASGQGGMAIVELPVDEVRGILSDYKNLLSIAASNSPKTTVVSGYADAIQDFRDTLDRKDIFCQIIQIAYASHSPQMDPLLDEYKKSLSGIKPKKSTLPMISTMTSSFLDGHEYDPSYWVRNLRDPVFYSQSIDQLLEEGYDIFLELSPHPVLSVSTAQCIQSSKKDAVVLSSLRRNEEEGSRMLGSMAELYALGYPIEFSKLYATGARCVQLPSYTWQHERYWLEELDISKFPHNHPFLGQHVKSAVHTGTHTWEMEMDTSLFPYLKDHGVNGLPLLPAAAYLEFGLAAAREAFGPGNHTLENISYKRALFFRENVTYTIQLVISPEKPGTALFQLFSRETSNAQHQESWNLYADGIIHIGQLEQEASPPEHSSIGVILARCMKQISGNEFYEFTDKLGFEYGRHFRSNEKLWIGNGETIAKINIPKTIKYQLNNYHVHPVILDSCLQLVLPAHASTLTGTESDAEIFLPVGLQSLRVYGDPSTGVWGHVLISKEKGVNADTVIADVFLLDEEGDVVIEAKGHTSVPLARNFGAAVSENLDDNLYKVHFKSKKRPEEIRDSNNDKPSTRGRWLIFADNGGIGKSLADRLMTRGEHCILVTPGKIFKRTNKRNGKENYQINTKLPEDMQKLLHATFESDQQPLRGVVHLWSLDTLNPTDTTIHSLRKAQNLVCGTTLHLIQALSEFDSRKSTRLWLVTQGAQAIGTDNNPLSIAQSPLWGLGRVISHEHPELRCTKVDLSHTVLKEEIDSLLEELFFDDNEDQIAFREKERYVARLEHFSEGDAVEEKIRIAHGEQPFRLEITKPGILDNLTIRATTRKEPGLGEVEIEVFAAGLNFIDLMIAMGIYPGQPDGPLPLGTECAGKIASVGKGVKEFHVGDEVIALAPFSFGTHVTTPHEFVLHKPSDLNFEEAATIPNVFLTAYYSLYHLGKIIKGESVLIHSAAGGVGQAAIQLAKLAGAEIFATAGSPEKREFLKSQGIKYVMDSRSLDFADEVMQITDGKGVDIVLNSLSGEAIPKGLSTLAPYGRFLEIGKRDIYQNSNIGLLPFKNSLSFYAIDLARMFTERPTLLGSLFRELIKYFDDGTLRPLPLRVFPISDAEGAFRFMAQAKHMGKIVLSMEEDELLIAPPLKTHPKFLDDGTCLITGGLGGLGLTMAKWMVKNGAKHLALLGRRGASDEASEILESMKNDGAQVVVYKADVSKKKQLENVFSQIYKTMPPIRGIIHAAGGIDDGILTQLNMERFNKVMAPKITGSWNLHSLTLDKSLDFFILFSSVASVLGSPGQGNYSAANAFLDSLAPHRRALGLPCQVINWGPWSEVGMAADPEHMNRMKSQGISPITPQQGVELMERIMLKDPVQVMPISIDWSRLLNLYPSNNKPPLLSEFVEDTMSSASEGKDSEIRKQLVEANPEERPSIMESFIIDLVANVLGIPPSRLDKNKPITNIGLDSLMALELKNSTESNLRLVLPVTAMLQGPSVSELSTLLINQMFDTAPEDEKDAENIDEILEKVEELSEEEAKALLEARRNEVIVAVSSKESGTIDSIRNRISNLSPEKRRLFELSSRSEDESINQSIIVKIQPNGNNKPFFCVHPVAGNVDCYFELSRNLGPEYPFYGLKSPGLNGERAHYLNLEDMARRYIDEIRLIQTQGPYRLGGHSLGGTVAFEMARQLNAQGQEVDLLAIFDSWAALLDEITYNDEVEREAKKMLEEFLLEQGVSPGQFKMQLPLKDFLNLQPDEQTTYILEEARNSNLVKSDGELDMIRHLWEIFSVNMRALLDYVPQSYNNHITLFKVSEQVSYENIDPTLGWGKLTSQGVDVHVIPGNHFSMLREPNVGVLAERLKDCLNKGSELLNMVEDKEFN
ncbi:SDR family NAD(P)-dependent oxidoreductase [Desulfobacterota bacterium AH_259_B03_O07]|nr:SDR family NAD(P)-dependent oxidoreductase [Desulfobacterota bacterium AH_259_B03_O07]